MRYLLFRLKRFCGFSAGFVFFISGILKLMDPVGAGLVMKEYFKFMHLELLCSAAMPSGFIFAITETIIGTGLITGVWRGIIALIAIVMQGFFTLLTLLLVIFQPEMDCGCFGEAVHLTHTETFVKNLILLTLLLIYYIPVKFLGHTKRKKYVSFGIVSLSSLAFALYSMLYIPINDFTDLRPGTYVNTGSAAGSYDAVFVYEKDGKEDRFTLEDLPDSSWTYIRTETAFGKESDDTPAQISIYDDNGIYADSLLTTGRIMAVSIYKDGLSEKEMQRLDTFLKDAEKVGFRPILLASSGDMESRFRYNCDYKTLITLNRSNGGATYIEDGYIIRKWAKRKLPAPEELATLSEEDPTDTFIGRDTRTSLAFQGFLLYVFAVMLLL